MAEGDGRPSTRRPADRIRYLQLAATLAAARPAPHYAVSHVTIADVAASVGVTRGALYRLWPSQQEFWQDLIGHLATHAPDSCAAPARPVPPATSDSLADAVQHALLADRMTLLRTAIAAHSGPDAESPFVARRAVRLTQLAEALDATVRATGRTFTPPSTATDLALAVTALGTGLPVAARLCSPEHLRFDSQWFDTPPGASRGMLGVATAAIRDALTQPAGRPTAVAHPRQAHRDPSPPAAGRRRAYLDAAAQLAVAPAGPALGRVLGHVTLDSVARAAGVSRRTLGSCWPDQRDFRVDLFAHLLVEDRTAVTAAVRTALEHRSPGTPSVTTFRVLGAQLARHVAASRRAASFRAFATHLDDDVMAARGRREHDRLVDACALHVQRLLHATRRRARSGVDVRQLVVLLFTLVDGFATLARTHPQAGEDALGPIVFEPVVAALFDRFTERLDGRPEVQRFLALIS